MLFTTLLLAGVILCAPLGEVYPVRYLTVFAIVAIFNTLSFYGMGAGDIPRDLEY